MRMFFTKDFIHFEDDRDISAKGFASPGDVIRWSDKYILPYQSYPDVPTMLCYSISDNLINWSESGLFFGGGHGFAMESGKAGD